MRESYKNHEENRKKLFEDYPQLLGEFKPREYKVFVPDGWIGILRATFDKVLQDFDQPPKVEYIKEKFGELRCVFEGSAMWDKYTSPLMIESRTICETCGQPGVTRQGFWISVLCDEHADGALPMEPFMEQMTRLEYMWFYYLQKSSNND